MAAVAMVVSTRALVAAMPEPPSAAAILQQLRSFREMGTVLHVAAHPDDENTQLITYLARGRGYRMGYLSLTRGDGGQNEIGPEFGEKLGVARTQELLAARRLDGGRQFFTRALDYGFSKDVNEALSVWDRQQTLGDVVRVIRQFRPDVVITRFSPQPGGTHGHHTGSAVLALEAFKIAGDATAFPEQLAEGLKPWQPKRIFLNGGFGGNNAGLKIDVGGVDPVLDESFASIAGRSRAMHKTQGFGNFAMAASGGGRANSAPRMESFQLLAGEPATDDIMDGVDVTWSRVAGGAEVQGLASSAIDAFKTANPAATMPALLEIRKRLAVLPDEPLVNEKRAQLDRLLAACLGLTVETISPSAEVVPGESFKITYSALTRSDASVKLVEVRVPGMAKSGSGLALKSGSAASGDVTVAIPAGTPISQPYWLREEPTAGMFRVKETRLIGRPENPPAFPVEYVFEIGGQQVIVPDEPLAAKEGSLPRPVVVISPVSLKFGSGVALFTPGSTKSIIVEATAAREGVAGALRLELPAGWKASPASKEFHASKVGEVVRQTFDVTAPANATTGNVIAVAEVGGVRYSNQRVEIAYKHIPLQLLQPAARLRAVALDVSIRGKSVGYLPGAGDDTAESLAQLGYSVTTLAGADLTSEKLKNLDAVVIGVRAFNERTDLAANLPGLFAYVENGGTVIAQYNRPNGLNAEKLGPYPLSIQGPAPKQRITDETAAVTFLAPDHVALTTPNRIEASDFAGWVQERGAYFPSSWDAEHYTTLLSMADPGEEPLKSSLLVAQHGKGWFVYTGLAFFRQLPAGVPGAYRLFANLVSLGK